MTVIFFEGPKVIINSNSLLDFLPRLTFSILFRTLNESRDGTGSVMLDVDRLE